MSRCYLCEPKQAGGKRTESCEGCGATYTVERDEFGLPVMAVSGAVDIICTAETLAAIRRNRRASA